MSSTVWMFLALIMVGVNLIGLTTDTGNASAIAQGSLGYTGLQGTSNLYLTAYVGRRAADGTLIASSVRPSPLAIPGAMLHLVERDPETNETAVSEQVYTVTDSMGVAAIEEQAYSWVTVSPPLVQTYPGGSMVVTEEFATMNGIRRLSLIKPRGAILGVQIPVISPSIRAVTGGFEKVDSVWTTAKRMITLDYAMFNIDVAPMVFLQLLMQALQTALGIRLGILIISLVRGA